MRRISDFRPLKQSASGFTLVEMIVAITLTAILSGIVVLFIRVPLQGFFDVSRRAELTDAADLAVRRITREVQGALPNSVRITVAGGVTYLEFLAVRTGGRYREQPAGTCPGGNSDELAINLPDTCFRTLGDLAEIGEIATGSDSLVVYNLGTDPLDATTNAYVGGNRVLVASATDGAGAETFTFASKTFPLASPSRRFFVVSGPVTYECNPTSGELRRHWGYAIAAGQLTPPAGASALLANGVSACTIIYETSAAAARSAAVAINLTLTRTDAGGNAESVLLYSQAHVGNSP